MRRDRYLGVGNLLPPTLSLNYTCSRHTFPMRTLAWKLSQILCKIRERFLECRSRENQFQHMKLQLLSHIYLLKLQHILLSFVHFVSVCLPLWLCFPMTFYHSHEVLRSCRWAMDISEEISPHRRADHERKGNYRSMTSLLITLLSSSKLIIQQRICYIVYTQNKFWPT